MLGGFGVVVALVLGAFDKRSALFSTGAEAVENAIKIARAATGRSNVLVFDEGYHGRSLLTMAMTAKGNPYKLGFGPFPEQIFRAPNAAPLRWPGGAENAASEALTAVELILAENGPESFAAMVIDEIQAGMGRIGTLFASEHDGVTGRTRLMNAVRPGGLGGIYAGNPLACAAALGVFEAFQDGSLLANAVTIKTAVRAHLEPLVDSVAVLAEVREGGAMLAIEFANPITLEPRPGIANAVAAACHAEGVLVLVCGTFSATSSVCCRHS